jgi:serine protease AprX
MNDNQMPSGGMQQRVGGTMPGASMGGGNDGMPHAQMGADGAKIAIGGMPAAEMGGQQGAESTSGERVLVELRVPASQGAEVMTQAASLPGLVVDPTFTPMPMQPADGDGEGLSGQALGAGESTVVIRAIIDPGRRAELEAQPNVVKVWSDGQIAPFGALAEEAVEFDLGTPAARHAAPFELVEGMAACPIGTCDCSPATPRGTIADVASYLGADQIWAAGSRGDGIVVGIVDGGIRAAGRTIKSGENGAKLDRVIGGWPTASWGTTAAAWSDHGMMCGTDVLGMAPNARLYDLRISDGDALSTALQAFQWAIDQHRRDGTPHILSNSWGMFQENWAPDYTKNPNHPFTRKVLEAIDEGIIVLFAAGNCGGTCPDGRCGGDSGPGRSIWGANGHARVITVGAVNRNEQFVGYSSQGPAALSPSKPDFCSITHFTGYFNSDSGTSAATPIAAGVVALLKQRKPSLSQAEAQTVLKATAKDIGPAGFDQHSGAGIIRAKAAHDQLTPATWYGWESLGGFCTDGVGASSWSSGRLDTFVVGNDRQVYHKWFSGGWSGWGALGGNLYSSPAAVSWGPNRIDVFALGGDHAMWHRWWDGVSWKGWESLGGFCTDGVGVSSWAPGRLDCFVVGNDRQLYLKSFNGQWSGWQSLGGNLYSNPTAVSWGPNRIDVFALGGDHAMWHRWLT